MSHKTTWSLAPFSRIHLLVFSVVCQDPPGYAPPGRSPRQPSDSGLPEIRIEERSHLSHRVDDLVTGDAAREAGQGQVGRSNCLDRPGDIALDTGHLYEARNGVTDESQEPGQSKGRRIGTHLRGPVIQIRESRRCHGTGGPEISA